MAKSKKLKISSVVGYLGALVTLLSLIGLAFTAIKVTGLSGHFQSDTTMLYQLVFGLDNVEINYYLLVAFILVIVGGLLLLVPSKLVRLIGAACAIAAGILFFLTLQVVDLGIFKDICGSDFSSEFGLCDFNLGLGTILGGCLACGGGALGLVSVIAK